MKNFLKLLVVFAFTLLVLLPQVVFAKVMIVDDGEFFNEAEIQLLEEDFSDSQFHYYIQTVQSLSGQDIGQQAEHLLDSVREQGYDMVILLSAEEREIYVDAMRGSTIDQTIRQHYGSNPYPVLLDETFIPEAVNGYFADGIFALISEMDSLTYEKSTTPVPQHEQTESKGSTQPVSNTKDATSDSIAVLIILLMGATLAFLFYFIKRKKAQQLVKELLERQKAMLANVLEPFNQASTRMKMSAGKTETVFKELNDELLALLTRVKDRESAIGRLTVPHVSISKFSASLRPFDEQSVQDEQQLDKLVTQLQQYLDKELETSRELEKLQKQFTRLETKLTELKEETAFSFQRMVEQVESVSVQLDKAIALDESLDFLSAYEKLSELRQAIATKESNLENLTNIINNRGGLPSRIEATESDVTAYVARERLKLADEDPYAIIEEARSALIPLEQATRDGHVEEARRQFDFVEKKMIEAKKSVETLVAFRDDTKRYLENLTVNIRRYEKLDGAFSEEMIRLEQKYARNHWGHLPKQFALLNELVANINKELPNIRSWLADEVQQYKKAQQTMSQLLRDFATIEELYEQCFQAYEQLETKKLALGSMIQTTRQQLDVIINNVRAHRLPLSWEELSYFQTNVQRWQQFIGKIPLNLEQLEKEMMEGMVQLEQLSHEITLLIERKRQAERQWQDVQSAFQSAARRYGGKVRLSGYRNRFRACEAQVSQLIQNGLYDDVRSEVQIARRIIEEMKKEYNQRVAEERMRAMVAAAAAVAASNRRSGGGGGSSGGWGGGGHSGGGSSWGSGGGSSFGGHSGGGSKW